jgi:drug/metabolite transporter (DMT)-like permease
VTAGALALFASAFLHASWNALLKRERDPTVAAAGVLAAALAVAAVAALLAPAPAFPSAAGLAWAAGAGVFEGVYFATLGAALARASYGAVYAIARGGALLVVWPVSALVLGEAATARGLAGAAAVGLGVALVAAGGARASRAAVALAAACAASIAGYHVLYDRALAAGAAPAPVFAVALLVALPFVGAPARLRREAALALRDRRTLLRWTVAGTLCTASFLLFLVGLRGSGAAVALTLRNTAVVFAQLLALAIGEAVPRRQALGAVLVAGGAIAVAWR